MAISPMMGSLQSVDLLPISFMLAVAGTVALGVYRLYFHPLARFPGDKLAALTGWVETYHDVFRGGQFIFKLEEWHAKYGPVIRISPWEVHIADPEFAEVMLAGNSKFDKKMEWKARFGIPHSTFDTIEHNHHRARRAALAPFFSKQKIAGISDFISTKAQRLCDRLEQEFKGKNVPITLNRCFAALAFDVVTFYAFAHSFEYMEHPEFDGPFTNAARILATTLHTMGHFPWLLALLQSMPKKLAAAMDPNTAAVFAFHGDIENQIKAIKSGTNDAHKSVSHRTVFNELLSSTLPPEEKAVERLRHEGGSIVAGGVETTASSLTKGTFFILATPRIHTRLLEELKTVFPDPRVTPSLAALESLPYLSAIINETLRMTIGISQRTIRISRTAPVSIPTKDPLRPELATIPAGCYFSMTTYMTHHDTRIWGDDPHEFRPERWLGSPTTPGGEPLSKYLLPFGRGPRMCIGMNLARAELFIMIAVLVRRCELELFETGREAVDMYADFFIPLPHPDTKGVRVLVK